eukprot:CAMPEP_0198544114 /NCGR_PEP_ID=MMETSP1462-20131121/60031_1 /TAXON_ID=1333877 /ORGANISM="Brandtodinium nutriculum, Strain RCC3387" /LENGTH=404 /DNA_ID=CAMNT_0044274425 /DNA_START=72 /DNA_END=1286 /DNA_ORIENTATION=-
MAGGAVAQPLLLLLGLAAVRLSAGLPSSIAARGADRKTNASLQASGMMTVNKFRVKNNCPFSVDLYQWGAEDGGVHEFPKKFGWHTVGARTTTPPLTRPKSQADLQKEYLAKEVRGCNPLPDGSYPPQCYILDHVLFRRSGFGGLYDGVELSFDFYGGGTRLATNQVPNLCLWYGYSFSHQITAYKPGSTHLACADAGAAFLGGDLNNCEKSGGARMDCTTAEGESYGGVDGAIAPGKGGDGQACKVPECRWPKYEPGIVTGSISDCTSNPVGYLRETSYCINKVDGQVEYPKQNCLCPDPTSAGCNTITGYFAPEAIPGGSTKEPCWYPPSKMQKGRQDGTCEKMKNIPPTTPTYPTNFGVWQDCIQHNVVADVELELCPIAPAAAELKPDPCPIDFPFAHPL